MIYSETLLQLTKNSWGSALNHFTKLKYIEFDKGLYRLTEPLRYRDGKFQYLVPNGFITDFASVPKIPVVYSHLKNDRRLRRPAVLHDHMYYARRIPRKVADKRFYLAMRQEGISKLKSRLIYYAVRAWGRDHW